MLQVSDGKPRDRCPLTVRRRSGHLRCEKFIIFGVSPFPPPSDWQRLTRGQSHHGRTHLKVHGGLLFEEMFSNYETQPRVPLICFGPLAVPVITDYRYARAEMQMLIDLIVWRHTFCLHCSGAAIGSPLLRCTRHPEWTNKQTAF